MDSVGERIRKVREDAGMPRPKFAVTVGTKPGYLAQLETGAGKPGRGLLTSIAGKFQVNEEWLTTGNGPQYIAGLDIPTDTVESAPEPTLSLDDLRTEDVEHLNTIYDYGDLEIINAIHSNLKTFNRTVQREIEVKELKCEVSRLTEECAQMKKDGGEQEKEWNRRFSEKDKENKDLNQRISDLEEKWALDHESQLEKKSQNALFSK